MVRIPTKKTYNQSLSGHFGIFGEGANTQIFFIQTGLHPPELRKVSLVSDIPGSEKWPVRDLFQREVDDERVTKGLLPYFKNPDRVKFFNPLTLTFLPIDASGSAILRDTPFLETKTASEDGYSWSVIENKGQYRFRWLEEHDGVCELEWNDDAVRLVAIDGQHRLSALKRYERDPEDTPEKRGFVAWTIPVVILGLRAIERAAPVGTILDSIRKIFVYINTEAKPVNDARKILLSDESVTSICTQELVDHSHRNDCLPFEERDNERLPLLFFDWRGIEENRKRRESPASIKTIEEVHDWLTAYVLGPDFKPSQEKALGIQPTDSLKPAFVEEQLDPMQAELVREQFRHTVLPGISHFLQSFSPYAAYVSKLRSLESELIQEHDIARHAFQKLRFGVHYGGDQIEAALRAKYQDIVEKILDLKAESFSGLLELDIGMRAVIYAFGVMKSLYEDWRGEISEWIDYAKWFTPLMNKVFDDGWLVAPEGTPKRMLLRHISETHTGQVTNYRLEKVGNALGALLVQLVATYDLASDDSVISNEAWEELWENQRDTLYQTLMSGYKIEVRSELKDQEPYIHDKVKLRDAVNEGAAKLTNKHLNKLQKVLEATLE